MRLRSGTAVVSCHVERPLDDAVWSAFERLLRRRPAGFVVTPFMRPPDENEAGDTERWLERARVAASLAPLGHHTHWGGAGRARPPDDVDAADKVRAESEWLRSHGFAPRYFCGGGWYWDVPVAETLAACGYVDCTATSFRQSYLPANAARLQLAAAARIVLPSGATLLELPATLATKLGIESGDWVKVSSARGELEVKALVTPRMKALNIGGQDVTVVWMPYNWGFQGLSTGASVNHLTIDAGDPGAGTQESKACLVNVVKAPQSASSSRGGPRGRRV